VANPMSDDGRRAFLMAGSRTAVLSTVRQDGRPHAAPSWFVLDGDDVVFTTGRDTVKGRNLRRTGQAALTVDDAAPPFDFVTVSGHVRISEDLDEMLPWAIALGGRYMGADKAEEFGRRNAVAGEMLVRLVPDHLVALGAIAD
jgi:PPOX class probable F420-dependent enzyme